MSEFSNYIVFADESGDHGLATINSYFPVFALAFCVVSKADYTGKVVPSFLDFKFRYWGHDATVLHESEIRRSVGDFTFLLTDRPQREKFYTDLSTLMADAPVKIIASVIDKTRLRKRHAHSRNPYEIALRFCLERLFDLLLDRGEEGRQVHVVFESRGGDEDRKLDREFRRIVRENGQTGRRRRDFTRFAFEPVFAKKAVNSTGLQLADLVVRPIALNTLRPDQPNRAMGIVSSKHPIIEVFP